MSHLYLPLPMLFNDRHAADPLFIVRETFSGIEKKFLVDFVDDHKVSGENMLEKPDRPFFERLRKYRVVRIGKGFPGHLPGFVPGESFMVDKDSHQLRDAEGRVSVVKLDRDFLVEIPQVAMDFFVPVDNVEDGR